MKGACAWIDRHIITFKNLVDKVVCLVVDCLTVWNRTVIPNDLLISLSKNYQTTETQEDAEWSKHF